MIWVRQSGTDLKPPQAAVMEPCMLTVSKDRPFLTTITGSLPRPHWFVGNLQGRPFSLAMTDIAFREQYTDAVAAYLCDQVRAGLDLLTDGDARCDCDVGGRSWFAYVTERLYGLEGHHVGRGRTASGATRWPATSCSRCLRPACCRTYG